MKQHEINEMNNMLDMVAPPPTATMASVSGLEPRWARKAREQQQQQRGVGGDRFIPTHKSMSELEVARHALLSGAKENLTLDKQPPAASSPSKEAFKAALKAEMTGVTDTKILSFSQKPAAHPSMSESMKLLYSAGRSTSSQPTATSAAARTHQRYVSTSPDKVLDAPELVDDYYLNLLDWGPENNVLAVALCKSVYLWHADTGEISELMTLPTAPEGGGDDNIITSLTWMRGGGGPNNLAVGTDEGEIQVWDTAHKKQLRSMRGGHVSRIACLTWRGHLLASGARDGSLVVHDVRKQQHVVRCVQGAHALEVCGLEWSPNADQLASGGNDNVLCVWDTGVLCSAVTDVHPKWALTHHCAAVKAVAWCPWQVNLLASGGGTADRTVRFWNTETGACVNSVDTLSQVTSLQWATHARELVSAHGFSNNQLSVWKYPSLEKVCDLVAHEKRILHTARSPDGSMVVSAGADETLRFWTVWPASVQAASVAAHNSKASSYSFQHMR